MSGAAGFAPDVARHSVGTPPPAVTSTRVTPRSTPRSRHVDPDSIRRVVPRRSPRHPARSPVGPDAEPAVWPSPLSGHAAAAPGQAHSLATLSLGSIGREDVVVQPGKAETGPYDPREDGFRPVGIVAQTAQPSTTASVATGPAPMALPPVPSFDPKMDEDGMGAPAHGTLVFSDHHNSTPSLEPHQAHAPAFPQQPTAPSSASAVSGSLGALHATAFAMGPPGVVVDMEAALRDATADDEDDDNIRPEDDARVFRLKAALAASRQREHALALQLQQTTAELDRMRHQLADAQLQIVVAKMGAADGGGAPTPPRPAAALPEEEEERLSKAFSALETPRHHATVAPVSDAVGALSLGGDASQSMPQNYGAEQGGSQEQDLADEISAVTTRFKRVRLEDHFNPE